MTTNGGGASWGELAKRLERLGDQVPSPRSSTAGDNASAGDQTIDPFQDWCQRTTREVIHEAHALLGEHLPLVNGRATEKVALSDVSGTVLPRGLYSASGLRLCLGSCQVDVYSTWTLGLLPHLHTALTVQHRYAHPRVLSRPGCRLVPLGRGYQLRAPLPDGRRLDLSVLCQSAVEWLIDAQKAREDIHSVVQTWSESSEPQLSVF